MPCKNCGLAKKDHEYMKDTKSNTGKPKRYKIQKIANYCGGYSK